MTDSAHTPSCEFCGRPLRVTDYTFAGVTIPVSARCDCPQAVAQRAAEEAAERAAHDADIALRRQRMYRRAGIPEEWVNVEPDASRLDALDAGRSLYLWGNVGAGKTTTACAALKAYIDAHTREWYDTLTCSKVALFVNASRMLDRLRATYSTRDEAEDAIIETYGKCDLLVLDDLGKGRQTWWTVEHIYSVVNERDYNHLPTIVTTQYALDQLGRHLVVDGDDSTAKAIVSRLYKGCKGNVLRFDGPDRRLG